MVNESLLWILVLIILLHNIRGQVVARLKDLGKTFPIRSFATPLSQRCGCEIDLKILKCIRGRSNDNSFERSQKDISNDRLCDSIKKSPDILSPKIPYIEILRMLRQSSSKDFHYSSICSYVGLSYRSA